MSLFEIARGLRIFEANSDTNDVDILFGTSVPGGDAGEQDAAALGSLFILKNGASSALYQKKANAGNSSDWELNGASAGSIGNWRPERVDALTNDTLVVGVNDPTAWTDNDGGFDGNDAMVGNYVIGDADGTPVLYEITAVGGANSITLAAASTPLATDDMLAVKYYLPDPSGQENQAIVTYDGSVMIKVADVDFASATGITLSGSYVAAAGDPTAGDTVEAAVAKLDGNNDAQDTLLGTAQGATDLGTFTGATVPDNTTVKGAIQAIETAYEETDQNVDDLITLTGVAENGTDLGSWTSPVDLLFSATSTIKALFQRIGDLLMQLRGVEETGITGGAGGIRLIDFVPVASVNAVKWYLEAFEEATPANRKAFEIYALGAANSSDSTEYAKLKIGANFNLELTVDATAANLRLQASSTTAGVTVRCRRIEVVRTVL